MDAHAARREDDMNAHGTHAATGGRDGGTDSHEVPGDGGTGAREVRRDSDSDSDTDTRPVPDRIAAMAARRPDAVAVRDHARALTYAALDERVARVAAGLAARGVGPGDVVGVCVERGADLVVALLAVWRTGAGYLPLDPAHPADRIAYVLADSGAALVVTDATGEAATAPSGTTTAPLATLAAPTPVPAPPPAPSRASASGLAYLMYTSGSTGRPKGVAVRHAAVAATLTALAARPGLGADDVLVAVTTAAFDISVVELFLPLLAGGTVVVAGRADVRDPGRLAALLAEGATLMQATPATWRLLLDSGWAPPAGFRVWCGGEGLPPDLAARLARTGVPVWDLYGPTETAIWSAVSRLGPDGRLTDWAPLAGERVTVLDATAAPAAPGQAGEVYIEGGGLADGYVGRAALTAAAFVPAPGGARRYRTGDLGRVLPDGRVEILGRADHQVKINGHRVELGEIEARLAAHPRVRAAVVHPRTTPAGGTHLVAYLTGEATPAATLTAHLRTALPDYMLPSDYVLLDTFPLNSNGKVDRAALPAPSTTTRARYVAPATEDEALLVRVCEEALGLRDLGTGDDLVALGVDSLTAARLVSALREATGAAPSTADVLRARTVAAVAALPRHTATPPSPPAPSPSTPPPPTFGQRALWFLHQLAPEQDAYVEPWAVRLRGPLDVAALRDRLRAVLDRHEPLRTRFPTVDGAPSPVLDPVPDAPFTRSTADSPEALAELLAAEPKRPFALADEPPFRARLVRLAEDDHALVISIHHLACDGLSLDILASELAAPTPPTELPTPYSAFTSWQHTWLASPEGGAQLDHWQRTLTGLDRSRLPTDRPRPRTRSTDGDAVPFTLPADLVTSLEELGAAQGATPFTIYLAAFQALLSRHAPGADVVVGTPAAARPSPALADTIGYFANQLPIRTSTVGNPPFTEFLARTRAAVLDAMDHQDVPFDRVVDRLSPTRSLTETPLFDTSFTYTPAPRTPFRVAGATAEPFPVPRRTAKFDLTLDLVRRPDGTVTGELEYATALYDRATATRLTTRFRTLLTAAARTPGTPLPALPLLPATERKDLAAYATGRTTTPPEDKLLHELIERVARTRPDATAVVDADGDTLTFTELNADANRLAHHLITQGVRPEDVVGVALRSGPPLLTTLLGILKAGAAYLPLDPADPTARHEALLKAAGAKLAIADHPLPTTPTLPPPPPTEALAELPSTNPSLPLPPTALAYVIFTSGSTGAPKGVQVEHRNIVNYVTWARDTYRSTRGRGAPLYSAMAFDLPVTSVFPVWAAGEPVTCGAKERGAENLVTMTAEGGFGLVKLTPSHLALLDQTLTPREITESTDNLVIGGEQLHGHMLTRWRNHAPSTQVINEYGPTETTVGCTWHAVRAGDVPDEVIPVGTPVANTTARVLDATLTPVPVGVFGDLWIGGTQVTRGYRAAPRQTAERFLPDPYASEPGARMYRTGDVARFRTDGILEYAGRSDSQLKLHGYRIEPHEVEAAIVAHPDVDEAVVVVRDEHLTAYITPPHTNVTAIRATLTTHLPTHLIPTRWAPLKSLPRTPSGKIDKPALPTPPTHTPTTHTTHTSQVAAEVSEVVATLLNIDAPDLDENFFDLGGDSLQAMKTAARLKSRFGTPLTVMDLFTATLTDLVTHIETHPDTEA
ncbi:amino acid adenylation domain-containing protein [Streptomyces sp. NPDC093111]|uniref:amino acid adenylation domain-containing protein n=1 Tax=Streptomyces sp. NPDC093111 TaxID=3154978 RepID=UPI00342A3A8D